ncbi:DUF3696 domain-containing protein [Nocardioides sp. MH1]|uniref:AAA family ATPase n=1 Tax=Nocardioides sp. MH1 TaxID=3242490 RepID=UPI0035224C20
MPEFTWYDGLTLRRWRLKNFKSVQEADVELAPLTVVVGANSAGKSTLLQSIRVAAQAANSNSDSFPLNAEQIRLGTFEETRFGGTKSDEPIMIGGSFHMGTADFYSSPATYAPPMATVRRRYRRPREVEDNTNLEWDLTLHGTPQAQTAATRIVAARVRALIENEEKASFAAAEAAHPSPVSSFGHEIQYDGYVREEDARPTGIIDASIMGGFPRSYLHTERVAEMLFWTWYEFRAEEVRANVRPGRNRLTSTGEPVTHEKAKTVSTDRLAGIVTEDLTFIYNEIPEETWHAPNVRRAIYQALRDYYTANPERLENDIQRSQVLDVFERFVSSRPFGNKLAAQVAGLPELLNDAVNEAQDFLATRVQHLGPLRMDPKVVYTSSPTGNLGFIGMKGEYTASVLHNNELSYVRNPPRLPNGSSGQPTLLQVVNRWAKYLGVADDFSTKDRGRLGLQLSVKQPDLNLELDLTSVGTGVSQILPVLVMCLQAPPGSLLLIEQPELHLNPGVQQRLADFLLAVAASGRQLIVETHSDYLVTRLRRRTAEDETGATQDRIALVFAERQGAATTYVTVKPERDGAMTNWPRGFFDDAADDSKALVQALLGSLTKPDS